MTKPVKDFDSFLSRYGSGSHHPKRHPLTTVSRSFYSKGLNKHKKKKHHIKGRKLPIYNLRRISDVPAFKKYRENVPSNFSKGAKGDYYVGGIGKGWRNVRADDHDRHVMAGMGMPSGRKPRAHRAFSIHQTQHGFELTPKSSYVDSRFDIPNTPSVAQEPQVTVPPVTTEFELNKKKVGLVEYGDRFSRDASNIGKSYETIRQEALAKRAIPLPTYEDVGAEALGRDIRTGSFYASQTGKGIKFVVGKLAEMKANKEKKEKERKYNEAQARAEQARLNRLEIQTELENRKLAELKGQSGTSGFAKQVVSEEDVKKAQEKNRGILGDFFKKKETEKVPVRLRETKKQVEKDYEGV